MGCCQSNYDNDEFINPINPQSLDNIPEQAFQIQVKLKPLKQSIHPSEIPQTLPCLLQFSSEGSSDDLIQSTRLGIDLVCVVDISGSMQGRKIELCKQTLLFVVDSLNQNDRLGIVLFQSGSTILQSLIRCSELKKQQMRNSIVQIKARKGTNLQKGLESSLKLLKGRRYLNNMTAVILLTDGFDNNRDTIQERALKTILDYRSKIGEFNLHTFAYGSNHDATLLESLAEEQNGGYYNIENYQDIGETFASCLGDIMSIAAAQIYVKFQENEAYPQCSIRQIYGHQSKFHFNMPILFTGCQRNQVFEISINPFEDIKEEYQLAPITVQIKAELARVHQIFKQSIDLEITVSPFNIKNEVDIEVLTHYLRQKVAATINLAQQLIECNDRELAFSLLWDLLREVENSQISDFSQQFIIDIRDFISRID